MSNLRSFMKIFFHHSDVENEHIEISLSVISQKKIGFISIFCFLNHNTNHQPLKHFLFQTKSSTQKKVSYFNTIESFIIPTKRSAAKTKKKCTEYSLIFSFVLSTV